MVTLTDDPLRALRAIRFHVRFGFRIDDSLMEALYNPILPDLMHVVSLERIREELAKAFRINTWATLDILHRLPRALVETWIRGDLWLMPTTKE
jgi:tRNA nucleotidyltransferase/poly(A) polymerase